MRKIIRGITLFAAAMIAGNPHDAAQRGADRPEISELGKAAVNTQSASRNVTKVH